MTARSASSKRSPLSYPAFRLLWLASIVTFIGSFVQNVGEAWLMMDLTKSPLPVAMLSTAFVGASLLAMLPAGILADRRERRNVAIASQLVQMVAALGMAALSITGHITPTALVAGVALLGLGMALGSPAWVSLLPELVPREMVAEAVAINAVAFNLARAVGPAIGGIVLARFGATTSFVLNAASFGVVTVALVLYRSEGPPKPPPSSAPLATAFAEPWRLVSGPGDLRPTFVAMLGFTFGAGIFYALTPAFAKVSRRRDSTRLWRDDRRDGRGRGGRSVDHEAPSRTHAAARARRGDDAPLRLVDRRRVSRVIGAPRDGAARSRGCRMARIVLVASGAGAALGARAASCARDGALPARPPGGLGGRLGARRLPGRPRRDPGRDDRGRGRVRHGGVLHMAPRPAGELQRQAGYRVTRAAGVGS
jgi:hypothetical protein